MTNQLKTIIAAFLAAFIVGGFALSAGIYSTKQENTRLSPEVQAATPAPEIDLKIKGNRKSKIYHLPGCASYNRISDRNVIWFKTKEEAEARGFRMARNC